MLLLFDKSESLEWVAKYIIYSINLPSFFEFFLTVDERLENSTVNKFFRFSEFHPRKLVKVTESRILEVNI